MRPSSLCGGGRGATVQDRSKTDVQALMANEPSRRNPVDRRLRDFARDQRSTMPRAEAMVWQQVRAGRFRGLKFKRQAPIAPYIVAFLCISARIVVELDGALHEEETRRRRDAERDAWLTEQGFQVLRFSNDLVLSNLGAVLDAIGAAIGQAHPKNPPPSAGEGGPRVSEGRERGAPDYPERPEPIPLPPALRAPSPAEGGGSVSSMADHPRPRVGEAFGCRRLLGFRSTGAASTSRPVAGGAAGRVGAPLVRRMRLALARIHGGEIGRCQEGAAAGRPAIGAVVRVLELRHRPQHREWPAGLAGIVVDRHLTDPARAASGSSRRCA